MLKQTILGAALSLVMLSASLSASTADDLQRAARKGKPVFLLVTDAATPGGESAREMIKAAMKQVKKSTLIELNRTEPANSPLVAEYRLAGAPAPLILVLAANGAIAGGIPAEKATPEQLVKMIPTMKKGEVLKAVQAGQAVLITASQKKMVREATVMNSCAAACGQMQGKCVSVIINLEDESELPFLNELKINPQAAEPVTVVINAQGQVTSSFQGAVEVTNLVQAANKKVGGCCPGGNTSSSSCAPAKK